MGSVKSKQKDSRKHDRQEPIYNANVAPQRQAAAPVSRPPPQPRVFQQPWRQIDWGNIQEDLEFVCNYQPSIRNVSHIRVLLYGPVGSGKSSFINSVSTVLRGRIAAPALANANNDDKSFTKSFKRNKIKKPGEEGHYPLIFNDIMGLEDGSGRGVSVDDVKLILKGHVKEGYKFNPVSSLSSDDSLYNPKPSLNDKVHVLVWVCSANSAEISGSVLQKMRDIREAASDMDIPQLAIVTKVDEACGVTEKDLKNVYKSKYLKEKMTEFSTALGIPLNCTFPVKNYSEEIDNNNDVDSLILSAVKMMINFGDDFINETVATD